MLSGVLCTIVVTMFRKDELKLEQVQKRTGKTIRETKNSYLTREV